MELVYWYLHLSAEFIGSCFNHKSHEWPAYWIIFMAVGGLSIIGSAVSVDDTMNNYFFKFIRRVTICFAILSVWPWAVMTIAPLIALGIVALIIWAWFDALPSKKARIAKKQVKIEELRGSVNKVQEGLR